MIALCVGLLLANGTADAPGTRIQSPALALRGVTIIDGTGRPAVPNQTVVIDQGRIRAVGAAADIRIPAQARVLDAMGKFLIPAFWDMHVHWYDAASLPLFTVQGVAGVRIMCGFPSQLQWRRDLAAGQLLGPHLVLAGPIVDGPHPVWPDSLRASTAAEGRSAVQAIKKQGYDCVKVYNLLPRSAYYGIAEEARRLGVPLVGHLPFAISVAEAADAGQQSIEHLSGVSLSCSVQERVIRAGLAAAYDENGNPDTTLLLRAEVEAEDTYDPDKAAKVFQRLVERGTWVVPTLVARQLHAQLGTRAGVKDAREGYLPASLKCRWDSRRQATLRKLGPADFANYEGSLRKQLQLVADMHRAGVRFLAGTDTGALDCWPGWSLHSELELLVQAGLSPMEALQAATRNPAQFLKRDPEQGTIKVGKVADLVLLDANPLEDIRNTTKIYAVLSRGRLLLPADLCALLAAVEAACQQSKPGVQPGRHAKFP
jgi:imidazolonepropionase-like amidohydrolase